MLARIQREEAAFGLVELLIAMTVLSIGILGLIAAFNAGALALRRASNVSTATAVADTQMERYRTIRYAAIGFDSAELAAASADPVYADDAPAEGQVTVTCASPLPEYCDPSHTVAGADGKTYRVDKYIMERAETDKGRPVKVVTVVVRDAADVGKALIRQQSTFDRSFG